MTTRQRRNPVVTATTAGVQTADAADAADAAARAARPARPAREGQRRAEGRASGAGTGLADDDHHAGKWPDDGRGGDADRRRRPRRARPPTARTVARLISQPDVQASSGSDVSGHSSSAVGWCGVVGDAPRRRAGRPARAAGPTPNPSREIYATRVAEVLTGPDGSFEYSWDPTDRVRGKLTSRVVCRVEMQAHVPGAHLRTVEVSAWDDSSDDIIEGAQRGAVGHHVQDRLRRAATRPGACCSSARPSSRRTTSPTTSSTWSCTTNRPTPSRCPSRNRSGSRRRSSR